MIAMSNEPKDVVQDLVGAVDKQNRILEEIKHELRDIANNKGG